MGERARIKKKLLENSQKYFDEIVNIINELPKEIKNKEFLNNELNSRDKTISDVICHLHEWHNMMENWYKIGLKGKIPEIPMKGYNWGQLAEVNAIINKKYKGTKLNDALKMFSGSHKKYSKEQIVEEIQEYGFNYVSEVIGAIHFEKSRSPYQWKKFNNNMQFDDIETGPIWNFIKYVK
jgi:hypothetical protein